MRFRQVHLDFHTSEAIAPIGVRFDKRQFQEMLKLGHVDSITLFSKCHHGWAYHPSEANEIHPGLSFDLLAAQIEAAHEIIVKTPVYLSAGLDEKLVRRHPEWLIRDKNDRTNWVEGFMQPGYHQFCMNSPYLDILIEQIREVVSQYDLDGLFLDIVGVRKCYCHSCVETLRRQGKDPRDEEAIRRLWETTYATYTARVKEVVESVKPGLPIFHNGGHIARGRRDLASMNTHLELESLPTGGWGYDHFPLSARYVQTLGVDFLGMTGKFHTSWGEFGGYKHPNALRYETALSLAHGARCSIGDQLHPDGQMDAATYELIGKAYREVESKEAWCVNATNVADVALLSLEATGVHPKAKEEAGRSTDSDAGAARMLLEGKFLFDVIDKEHDFLAYQVLILPDYVAVDDELGSKLKKFLQQGGKILATGWSGLDTEGTRFAIDFGVRYLGVNPYRPDYFRPYFKLESLGEASFIIYTQGQKIELAGGTELGRREDPYFNRDVFTFCSHQHTPCSYVYGGPGMVESDCGIYLAWNVFEDYANKGSLILKETILHALNRLLPNKTLHTSLPAQGVVTLQEQKEEKRLVQHLLYASPVRRGKNIEVIEDILPLYDVEVSIRTLHRVKNVYLAPQMQQLPFRYENQTVFYTVPKLECHQMVVIDCE
ncbi:beta-galactosidase trimerization domain-containing protein [Paenibacillus sp. KQZ6P-2]|uniref:Beta-galactosidase trimerization domain-containing protein n=1 Tax=Paenibacillus mangrovi TaxID=2931978 RepID=A0A9X1WT47_9BACL|nr:beta-galactosidase trimerization domain-containing protein [Paenibacillus mangrovi]MCJ8014604.1 beta-galactosidase trimerization domain-containing protein [Paenibacillus mangrovi]